MSALLRDKNIQNHELPILLCVMKQDEPEAETKERKEELRSKFTYFIPQKLQIEIYSTKTADEFMVS